MSQLLLTKIEAVRRKRALVATCSAIALAITALVVLVAAEMLLDWIFDFALPIRAAALVFDLVVVGYLLTQYMFIPLMRGADDDELALMVEAEEPQFSHRLIGSIQLSRANAIPAGASISLVRTMIEQAESMARAIDFTRVIKVDRLMRNAITAALVVLVAAAGFVYGDSPDHTTGDLLQRAFLSNIPVPRKTHVVIDNGDKKIARGDSVDLLASAQGIVPSNGTVFLKSESGRTQEFPMDPTPEDHSTFKRQIQQVQESFTYTVKLNDGMSKTYSVKVLGRPEIADLKIIEHYPAYTKRHPIHLEPGNLSVLVGSELELRVTGNHKMRSGFVHLVGSNDAASSKTAPANGEAAKPVFGFNANLKGDLPLVVDPSNPTVLTTPLPFKIPPKTSGFSINLTDTDDLENKDPVVYRVDLEPDKDPIVKITLPINKEEMETKDATFPIAFTANDDFGLASASLKYKVDDGPVIDVPFTIIGDPLIYSHKYVWDLGKVTVPPTTTRPSLEGGNIEYWVEVLDNNNATGPGKGVSEHFLVKIVSREAKEEQLAQEIRDQLQHIQDVKSQQEGANQKTSGILVPGKNPPPQP